MDMHFLFFCFLMTILINFTRNKLAAQHDKRWALQGIEVARANRACVKLSLELFSRIYHGIADGIMHYFVQCAVDIHNDGVA